MFSDFRRPAHLRSIEARKQRNKNKGNRKREQKRRDHEENQGMQFEQENRVMELEKINAILKRAIKKSRQFDVRHGSNKATYISYSTSFLRLHQDITATILRVLKKGMHVFTRNNLIFDEKKELGAGIFGVVRLGFIPSIQQTVAVKISSEKLSQTDILAETKIELEMSDHPNFAYVFRTIEPNKLLMEYIDGKTQIVKMYV